MSDRFDEMAGRVQLDVESYALRQSIDGRRRVIAEALRASFERGRHECLALLPVEPPKEASGEVFQLRAEVERLTARCVVLQENLGMCCETPPPGCDCSGCSWARQQSEASNDE